MTIIGRGTATTKRRYVATVTAMAIALSILPLIGSAEAKAPAAAIVVDDACNNVLDQGFTDVFPSNPHADMIECLAAYGITRGTGDGDTYEPNGNVRRWQMALFLVRLAKIAADQLEDLELPQPSDRGLTDIDELGVEAQDAINVLSQLDVTRGKTTTTYDPFSFVDRAQMASFINRLQAVLDIPYASAEDFFTDDEHSVHEANINALASIGIVQGFGDGLYGPGRSVTRGQMASFIMRLVEQNLDSNRLGELLPVPDGRQMFTVLPGDVITQEVGTSRQFTVDLGRARTVDIALFSCNQLSMEADGYVSFSDANDDGIADWNESTVASITVVDGVSQAENSSIVEGHFSSDGFFSLTVRGDTNGCVVPVIYEGDAAGVHINLNEKGQPSEHFGVGGKTTFGAPEARHGNFTAVITSVDLDSDRFLADNSVYIYDMLDQFYIGGIQVSMAKFESLLSSGDTVSGTYSSAADGISVFDLTDTPPAAPSGVSAHAADHDSDGSRDDVRISWTTESMSAVTYNVKRVADDTPADTSDDEDSCNASGVTVASAVEGTEVTEQGVPDGTYYYCVQSQSGTGALVTVSSFVSSNQTTVPDIADTTAPLAIDTELITSSGFENQLDAHDVVKTCFSESLPPFVAGDAVELTDGVDSSVGVLTNGGNAMFALGAEATPDVALSDGSNCPANQTLVITVTDVVPATGGDEVLNLPATITDQSGIADLAGNLWSPMSAGNDRVVAVEPGPEFD